jgi:dipeptidyl aminopeptidase/acylaminoacyl peptidase
VKFANENATRDILILSGFNHASKENGFYRIALHHEEVPMKLTFGPHVYYARLSGLGEPVIKATEAQVYLVRRESASESPNYFVTRDFKTFNPVSSVYPEKDYNWMRSKLISFKTTDERTEQGILYLPENFDPKKKYPLIFHYYELKSDELNEYRYPSGHPGDLNIPWFTSQGYLVFVPDFHYVLGKQGECILHTVEGATRLLKMLPYADAGHMGLQGHSHGGSETNYLIAHTTAFAAAVSSAGETDLVSENGALWNVGNSKLPHVEYGQGRIGAMLWERPDLYIKNSPIFYADKVTTPVMLVANKRDGNVPFTQGLEFFAALRRMGKKAWMLQYDNDSHGEFAGKDRTDYLIRSTQFFDHYLKGAPAPKWMVEGIPASKKQVDDGLELEPAGVEPGPGLLTPDAQKKVDALKYKKPVTVTFN